MQWFKFHSEFIHDPKLKRLTKEQRYDLVCLMCMANESSQRGSVLMDDETMADALDCELPEWAALRDKLIDKGILKRVTGVTCGVTFIHWTERQKGKPSDEPQRIAQRVRKHRASKMDVTTRNALQTPVTPIDKNRIEKIREDNTLLARKKLVKKPSEPMPGFQAFWDMYPRSEGKQDAITAWNKLLTREPAAAFSVMADLEDSLKLHRWSEPRYAPHGATYLNKWDGGEWKKKHTNGHAPINEPEPPVDRYAFGRRKLEAHQAKLAEEAKQNEEGLFNAAD